MTYIEANVEEDELEVERAIVILVKEKLPPSLLQPVSPGSRKVLALELEGKFWGKQFVQFPSSAVGMCTYAMLLR